MVFVNRRDELGRLEHFAETLAHGAVERHLAFVGVRRIGKSRILARFVESHPATTTVVVQVDEASTTLQAFLLYMVRASVDALARRTGRAPLSKLAGPVEIATEAGLHGAAVADLAQRALSLVNARRPDGQQVFTAAVGFPEELASVLNQPVLVFADEMQHILDLAVYPPFSAGGGRSASDRGQQRLLQVFRASIERRPRVGWVVTGSGVRLLRHILGEGPLMGRFDERLVGHFDPEDCAQLARAVWIEVGVEATDSAIARVYRLSQGHPFYADVVCREAAYMALKLDRLVSATHVDSAFLDAVQRPGGPISVACREMFDSLNSRAPALQGMLQALAAQEPATLGELAERAMLSSPNAAYRYVEDLTWLGMVQESAPRGYVFTDPVFRYWLACSSDPLAATSPPLTGESARRAAGLYQEAYLRERELHGILSEGYVRDICSAFAAQVVPGRRFGVADQSVVLPRVGRIERIVADNPAGEVLGKPAEIELDLRFGDNTVWLGEIKRRRRPVDASEIAVVLKKAQFIRRAHRLGEGPCWVVSDSGFTEAARETAHLEGAYLSSFADLEAIRTAIATRTPSSGSEAQASG